MMRNSLKFSLIFMCIAWINYALIFIANINNAMQAALFSSEILIIFCIAYFFISRLEKIQQQHDLKMNRAFLAYLQALAKDYPRNIEVKS